MPDPAGALIEQPDARGYIVARNTTMQAELGNLRQDAAASAQAKLDQAAADEKKLARDLASQTPPSSNQAQASQQKINDQAKSAAQDLARAAANAQQLAAQDPAGAGHERLQQPELGGGGGFTGEVTDAIAGYWQDLGLTVFSLKYSYQTFRPTVVGRTNTIPFVTSCDKGREANPWHFPKGHVQTTLTRGGFGCGFESDDIFELYTRMATAPDQAAATAAAEAAVRHR